LMCTFVFGSNRRADWKIYMNGRSVTTIASGDEDCALTYTGTESYIGKFGKANTAADSYFNGQINNVGVWYKALDESNIKGLFNDGFPPDIISGSGGYVSTGSAELLAYWPLSEGESTRTTDKITRTAGALVNGASFEKVSPLDEYSKE